MRTPLTRYYAEAGCPPGVWSGSGVRALGDGRLRAGDEQLGLLMGQGRDPVSGEPLGRAFPADYRSRQERIGDRVAALDRSLGPGERAAAVAEIEAEEAAVRVRRAVAGYDYTFSAPKSVSVLWAVTDAETQSGIAAAHHAAVTDVLDLMEREVAATRTGAAGPDGAVAQVEVGGLVATGFDHYDSRAGDPQLHTHVAYRDRYHITAPDPLGALPQTREQAAGAARASAALRSAQRLARTDRFARRPPTARRRQERSL
jgi:hypothetical protein